MTHLPLWVLHSEMRIEQNKWSFNGCSIPDGRFELDTTCALYLGALIVVLQNGFNIWLTLEAYGSSTVPFLDQFWVYGSPVGDSLRPESEPDIPPRLVSPAPKAPECTARASQRTNRHDRAVSVPLRCEAHVRHFVEHLQRQLGAPRVTESHRQCAYKQSKVSGCYRDFWAAGEMGEEADSLGEETGGEEGGRVGRLRAGPFSGCSFSSLGVVDAMAMARPYPGQCVCSKRA
jgi:hypothetical protein